jgi:hypothetical protein
MGGEKRCVRKRNGTRKKRKKKNGKRKSGKKVEYATSFFRFFYT